MAELKTKPTKASVTAFLDSIELAGRREDAVALCRLMADATGEKPRMWGTAIIGFGERHYVYQSGREGDWFPFGFSPRKDSLVVYLMEGFSRHGALLAKLGRYTTGKSCLYVKRLADVDQVVLASLIKSAAAP